MTSEETGHAGLEAENHTGGTAGAIPEICRRAGTGNGAGIVRTVWRGSAVHPNDAGRSEQRPESGTVEAVQCRGKPEGAVR